MQDIVMFFGLAFLPVTVGLVAMLFAARGRAQRAEALVHELAVTPAIRGERRRAGATPESGIDIESLAIEIERLAEAQRFTMKLLSDRFDHAERKPRTSNTPH